jgi:proteasome lid subunit RPN8/RPN11
MIKIPENIKSVIYAESEKAYPNECCGILIGRIEENNKNNIRLAVEVIPITNSREQEEQYHRFQIEPDDLMKAEFYSRKQGLEVLGFYHSHPDHPAEPSEFDREHALPFYSYVILSVANGKAVNILSWELDLNREKFSNEEII